MKTIPLTRGLVALVDDADFDNFSQHRWLARKRPGLAYAARATYLDGKQTLLFMHRVILGSAAHGLHVDHIDGNGLNNQRANLRACSRSENQRNRGMTKTNKTGFKGVTTTKWNRNSANKYVAQIQVHGKKRSLGYFPTPEQAHTAYCEAAKNLHGEFARLV